MANFQRDQLHFFKYTPKWGEILPFWDKQPLMFPLYVGSTHTLGVNIHWIPAKFRKRFVEWLLEISQKVRSRKRFAHLTYAMMQADPRLKQAQKRAIRMYINNRASKLKIIPKDEVASFFLPLTVNPSLFRRHKSKKVFYPDRGHGRTLSN